MIGKGQSLFGSHYWLLLLYYGIGLVDLQCKREFNRIELCAGKGLTSNWFARRNPK